MAVKISSVLNDQQFNSNGVMLSGGKIETYLAGSTTPATTFTSDAGTTAQPNPIILNTRGEVPNLIYLTTGVKYKFLLKDAANNLLRTYDNIEGVNDSASSIDQWINTSVSPTYINATQFSLAGDQTSIFTVNRRVKILVTAGTLYGYISVSAYTTLTTITVVLDSGVLDAGLSSVQLGLITTLNSSLRIVQQQIGSGVAGTGPAFSAYASSSQSISSGVATRVTLGTVSFDTNNNFSSSRFTPTVAGYYLFTGVVRGSSTNGTQWSAAIYKNASAYRFGNILTTAASSNNQNVNVTELVFCNGTTDYIELFALFVGTTPSLIFSSSDATSSFSGVLVRSA